MSLPPFTTYSNASKLYHATAIVANVKANIRPNTKVVYILDPFSAYLCQRGMRTMDVRLERQCKNAAALAKALKACLYVEKVLYPGLAGHPQRATAVKQFKGDNCGAILSFYMPEFSYLSQ